MSCLDRIMLWEGWVSMWGDPSQWELHRDVSDHRSILLRYSILMWGPKPFRFNNHWLQHRDCKSVVSACWTSCFISIWMGCNLKRKTKVTKSKTEVVEQGGV